MKRSLSMYISFSRVCEWLLLWLRLRLDLEDLEDLTDGSTSTAMTSIWGSGSGGGGRHGGGGGGHGFGSSIAGQGFTMTGGGGGGGGEGAGGMMRVIWRRVVRMSGSGRERYSRFFVL